MLLLVLVVMVGVAVVVLALVLFICVEEARANECNDGYDEIFPEARCRRDTAARQPRAVKWAIHWLE